MEEALEPFGSSQTHLGVRLNSLAACRSLDPAILKCYASREERNNSCRVTDEMIDEESGAPSRRSRPHEGVLPPRISINSSLARHESASLQPAHLNRHKVDYSKVAAISYFPDSSTNPSFRLIREFPPGCPFCVFAFIHLISAIRFLVSYASASLARLASRSRRFLSRIRLRMRRLVGVTSSNSSSARYSMHSSRLISRGGADLSSTP